MTGIDQRLFRAHEHALEQPKTCPHCQGQLQLRKGRHGPFLRCLSCDYSAELHEHIDAQPIPDSQCPECGASLVVRQGRYGMFIGCSAFPECHWHQSPQAPQDTGVGCPSCGQGKLTERTSRYGKRFYSCDRYPKCRYSLNGKPLAEPCPECGGLLIEKRTAAGVRHVCVDKDCAWRSELQD